jgi:hypothetical protein
MKKLPISVSSLSQCKVLKDPNTRVSPLTQLWIQSVQGSKILRVAVLLENNPLALLTLKDTFPSRTFIYFGIKFLV